MSGEAQRAWRIEAWQEAIKVASGLCHREGIAHPRDSKAREVAMGLKEQIRCLQFPPSAFALPNSETIPAVLFDGWAVYEAMGKPSDVSARNVAAVLDAVVRLIRANRG